MKQNEANIRLSELHEVERLLQYTVAAVFEFDNCEGHVNVDGDSCLINT